MSSWRSFAVAASLPSLDALRRHCSDGRQLRVLTTTYTGSTEQAALGQLVDLGADVRVSYDLSTTRLHAKAWVFHRRVRVLDRLRRFIEPHPLGAGHRHRVERAGLSRPQPGRDRQVRRGVRQLLGRRRLPAVRRRPVRRGAGARRANRLGAQGDPEPDRAAPAPVPGAAPRTARGIPPAGAPPQPARLGHRHRQDGDGGPRLRPPPRNVSIAPACCSSRTARRSSTRALATFRYALRDPSFGEKWVGGARPTPLRARLRLDPEPQRRPTSTRSRPITSTW